MASHGSQEEGVSVEQTRKVIEAYFNAGHDNLTMMADDVVFTDMASGQEHTGPEAVEGMLNWFYSVAFDATAETTNMVYADGHAVWEGVVKGKHIGEFAGILPTNKTFSAPIVVSYDVSGDKIVRGRVYFSAASFMKQVGVLG